MKFLAKSKDKAGHEETIVEHTNELLNQLAYLKTLYPQALSSEGWELLEVACVDHDLGKMNLKFQEKLQSHQTMLAGEIPHALLSITLLNRKQLESIYAKKDVSALYKAIAFHHYRDLSKYNSLDYKTERLKLNEMALKFPFSQIKSKHQSLLDPGETTPPPSKYFNLETQARNNDRFLNYDLYVMLKGLLNRIDYAASGHYDVEKPAGALQPALLKNTLQKWREHNLNADWNEMQRYVLEHRQDNLIIRAQTGMGKTEAALLWATDDKTFFTLPLRIAIDSIYTRLSTKVFTQKTAPDNIGKLDSDTDEFMLSLAGQMDSDELEVYGAQLKSWSLPLTITTLDQVFNFVYHYINFEMKLATLSYSKVIIDEIQMYDENLLAYIIYGLGEILRMGGHFMIMTATLPEFVVDLLCQNKDFRDVIEQTGQLPYKKPEPFIKNDAPLRHNIKIERNNINAEKILTVFDHNKVLVVCNTIQCAIKIYNEIVTSGINKDKVHLIHSHFIHADRMKKQTEILEFGDIHTHDDGIWIGTQILEASLDLDFDVLLTELSELNGLFQRMGRCYRNRDTAPLGTNVFVFVGTDDIYPSGIKYVVDAGFFKLSRMFLMRQGDGPLNEATKMNLVETTYTTDNIKEYSSQYYQRLNKTMVYLQDIANDGKTKSEVDMLFRGIDSKNVIPQSVYVEHEETIRQAYEILTTPMRELSKNGNENPRNMKSAAIVTIKNFLVPISNYQYKKLKDNNRIDLDRLAKKQSNFHYLIADVPYDDEIGLQMPTINVDDFVNEYSNIF